MGLSSYQLQVASLSTLIKAAQADVHDDTPAMDEIIRRFERLTRRIALTLTRGRPELFDDVANAARIGLVRAARRHDQTRIGFPSYAARFMRGAALRELELWRRDEATVQPVPVVEDEQLAPSLFEDSLLDELAPWGDGVVAEAIDGLSPSQQHLASLRYVQDAPLEAIASLVSTSVPAVSQRLKTIHRNVQLALAA